MLIKLLTCNFTIFCIDQFFLKRIALREKCPHSESFWSVFSHIWTKYGSEKLQIRTLFTKSLISVCSVLSANTPQYLYFLFPSISARVLEVHERSFQMWFGKELFQNLELLFCLITCNFGIYTHTGTRTQTHIYTHRVQTHTHIYL